MDSSIMPTRHAGLSLVQTTDFFYPLVEDPYKQGQIACANVLSDLYAMGVDHCDNMLMILAASRQMVESERTIVTRRMIEGFHDHCVNNAGSHVTGGQTVLNPWPIIGGVATSVCADAEIIKPVSIVPGNVLVLTKPLGTQVAVNLRQWINDDARAKPETATATATTKKPATHLSKALPALGAVSASDAFLRAESSMIRLNRTGARLMRKHGSLGATDVTGFGILGHATNLASNQQHPRTRLVIDTLPVIAGMAAVDDALGGMFGLRKGRSAETSGGLLLALPDMETAARYVREIEEEDGRPAWIVGRAVEGERGAEITADAKIVEVA